MKPSTWGRVCELVLLVALLAAWTVASCQAATCVQTDVNGVVSVVSPQPADVTTCTLVLATPAEVTASPFVMTVGQGAEIGMSIVLASAIAWGFRLIAKAIGVGDETNGDDNA